MALAGFGLLLRTCRERGGWSRRELAEGAGLSEGAVRDYELGKRSPSFEAVCRLAVALGVKVMTFTDGMDVSGAYRLEAGRARIRYSILMFGKHKGQRISEVPGDYLDWMVWERPKQLRTGQWEEAKRVLEERDRDRRAAEAEANDPLAGLPPRDRRIEEQAQRTRAAERAARTDPVMARALREKHFASAPATMDPEWFGADTVAGADAETPEAMARRAEEDRLAVERAAAREEERQRDWYADMIRWGETVEVTVGPPSPDEVRRMFEELVRDSQTGLMRPATYWDVVNRCRHERTNYESLLSEAGRDRPAETYPILKDRATAAVVAMLAGLGVTEAGPADHVEADQVEEKPKGKKTPGKKEK